MNVQARDVSEASPEPDGLEVLSAIGHELRNIVGAVIHQIELLSGDLDDTLRARSRTAIIDSAYELNRFVDAVTDLERLQRSEMTTTRAPIDLDELLDAVIGEAEWRSPDSPLSGITADVSVTDFEPVDVLVDISTIRRVLTIAISESVARLGDVEISVTQDTEHVQVRFGAGDDERGDGHRGVRIDDGLGLWVAAQLARLSDASLETTTSATSMRLVLGLVAADDRSEEPRTPERTTSSGLYER